MSKKIINRGRCGSCTWQIDTSMTLTISPVEGTDGILGMPEDGKWPWTDTAKDIKKISIEEGVKAGASCRRMFAGMSSCKIFDISKLDMTYARSMNEMFLECSRLEALSFAEGWNTSNVTRMDGTFDGCISAKDFSALAGLNVSKVESMSEMLKGCKSVESIGFMSGWNTANLEDMSGMLEGCVKLKDISAFRNINVENVKDMSMLLSGCKSVPDISAMEGWDTSSLQKADYMIEGCESITHVSAFAKWNTINLTSMQGMVKDCYSLKDITGLKDLDTSYVTDMSELFCGCHSLQDLSPVAGLDTGSVVNMNGICEECYSLQDISPVTNWDTRNVKYMSCAFRYDTSLSDISALANLDMRNVVNVNFMMQGCSSIKDISSTADWNIDWMNALIPTGIFAGCPDIPEITLVYNKKEGSVTLVSPKMENNRYIATDIMGDVFGIVKTGSFAAKSPSENCRLTESEAKEFLKYVKTDLAERAMTKDDKIVNAGKAKQLSARKRESLAKLRENPYFAKNLQNERPAPAADVFVSR